MQSELGMLTDENGSLKKENKSLKRDNTLMNQTLRDQAKEIDRLRNDLFQLKSEYEKQNVLVQTLSGLLVSLFLSTLFIYVNFLVILIEENNGYTPIGYNSKKTYCLLKYSS